MDKLLFMGFVFSIDGIQVDEEKVSGSKNGHL